MSKQPTKTRRVPYIFPARPPLFLCGPHNCGLPILRSVPWRRRNNRISAFLRPWVASVFICPPGANRTPPPYRLICRAPRLQLTRLSTVSPPSGGYPPAPDNLRALVCPRSRFYAYPRPLGAFGSHFLGEYKNFSLPAIPLTCSVVASRPAGYSARAALLFRAAICDLRLPPALFFAL